MQRLLEYTSLVTSDTVIISTQRPKMLRTILGIIFSASVSVLRQALAVCLCAIIDWTVLQRNVPSVSSARIPGVWQSMAVSKPMWNTAGPASLSRYSSLDREKGITDGEETSVVRSLPALKALNRLGVPKLGLPVPGTILHSMPVRRGHTKLQFDCMARYFTTKMKCF